MQDNGICGKSTVEVCIDRELPKKSKCMIGFGALKRCHATEMDGRRHGLLL